MSIENYFVFSESNQLKNQSFRLPMKFTESPKFFEMRGLIKYCPNALQCSKITHTNCIAVFTNSSKRKSPKV